MDLKRDLNAEAIDALVESGNWFPFVETWSNLTPSQMFETLANSPYGGSVAEIPKIRIQFIPADFKTAIPSRFLRPIPPLATGEGTSGFVILTHDVDNLDYRLMNAVGEFYMEDLRLSSSRRRFMPMTPIEMWDHERHRIVEIARTKSGPDTGAYEIRNAIFSHTKESNPFRPSVALAVYALLNAHSILDMSSGWGDRLLGALAWARRAKKPIRYQGYDPFAELQPRYSAMIGDLGSENTTQFSVTCSPFEEAPIEEGEFDVAFTSPPYFDFEEYGHSAEDQASRTTQSTVRYPQQQDWIDNFLKPMMVRAARSLRVGGYLAMNIEGPFMYKLLEQSATDPLLFGQKTPRMAYYGILGYRSNEPRDRVSHPTFVWTRTL